MQQKNLVLFIILSLLILFGTVQVQRWLNPNAGKQLAKPAEKAPAEAAKKAPAKRIHLPRAEHPVDPGIQLGNEESKLRIVVDPWGAGVRSVTLNQFQEADALGKPVRANGQGVSLDLIQADKNLRTASNLLYHF